MQIAKTLTLTHAAHEQASMKQLLCTFTGAAFLCVSTGCATSSKDLSSSYVSPIQYQAYDCGQLAAESQRIQARVTELGGRLDQAATNDKILMGVTLVLFWPAAFALGGTKQQEAEYSRIKGELEAVDQAVIAKKCQAVGRQATQEINAGS